MADKKINILGTEYTVIVDKAVRHGIVHAFLHESGLDSNSDWARNDELVDWIATQLPKLAEACKDYMGGENNG